MFHPMALTVMLALAGALLLALTLMPVLCSFVLRGKVHEGDNIVIRLAKGGYERILNLALRFRWVVVTAAVALFAGSLWLFAHLGAEFVPKLAWWRSKALGLSSLSPEVVRRNLSTAMASDLSPRLAKVVADVERRREVG